MSGPGPLGPSAALRRWRSDSAPQERSVLERSYVTVNSMVPEWRPAPSLWFSVDAGLQRSATIVEVLRNVARWGSKSKSKEEEEEEEEKERMF